MKTLLAAWLTILGLVNAVSASASCPPVQQQPERILGDLAELPAYAAYRDQVKDERYGTHLDYHQLAATPSELIGSVQSGAFNSRMNLRMPIYFIGIEKLRRQADRHVSRRSCEARDFDPAGFGASLQLGGDETTRKKGVDAACQVLDDKRPMLLTHISRSDGLAQGRYQPACLLHSVYPGGSWCGGSGGRKTETGSAYDYNAAVNAVEALRPMIEREVQERRPTHLLVLSTGWNTQQDESLYNYLDWLSGISRAAGNDDAFRPLVVAFTWQSGFDRIPRGLGVVTKGNDADEIGLSWANRVINDVVMPVAQATGTPVAMVGHSYGTRVLGSAVFGRSMIKRDEDILGRGTLPVALIALQPAVPVQRFSPQGKEPLYANWQSTPLLTVLTTSPHDHANSALDRWWGVYAGGGKAIETATEHIPAAGTGSVDGSGRLSITSGRHGLHFVDASKIIRCNMPDTGGGAHSDVFHREAGQLIWDAIQASSLN